MLVVVVVVGGGADMPPRPVVLVDVVNVGMVG